MEKKLNKTKQASNSNRDLRSQVQAPGTSFLLDRALGTSVFVGCDLGVGLRGAEGWRSFSYSNTLSFEPRALTGAARGPGSVARVQATSLQPVGPSWGWTLFDVHYLCL